jgi:hypothetical protein
MINKRGISLIVLVITIIVIIILAGSVILSLSKNNPILSAQEATFKNDMDSVQNGITMYITSKYAQTLGGFDVNSMNGEISTYILNMTKYDSTFDVVKGKLIYTGTDIQTVAYARNMNLDVSTVYNGTVEIIKPTINVVNKTEGTVESWVNVTNSMKQELADKYIFSTYADEKYTNTLVLRHTRDNTWQAIMSSDYNQVSDISIPDTLNDGWHLFSMKWNVTEFSLYIDGIKVATTAAPKLMTAVATNLYIGSGPKLNLVKNGYLNMGNNTNLLPLNYWTLQYYSLPSSLQSVGGSWANSNEFIQVDPNKLYSLSGYFKSVGTSGSTSLTYYGIDCYDRDYQQIGQYNTYHMVNTETVLSRDLNPGDTVMYVNNASNWKHTADVYNVKYVGISNNINYPDFAYTRNSFQFSDSNQVNNTITLVSAYTGPIVNAGTKVANYVNDGGGYRYNGASGAYPSTTTWQNYSGTIQYTNIYNTSSDNIFRYATKYVKVLMLLNYSQNSTYATLVDDIEFKDMTNTIFNSKIQELCISNIARSDVDILNRYKTGILVKDSNVTYMLTD